MFKILIIPSFIISFSVSPAYCYYSFISDNPTVTSYYLTDYNNMVSSVRPILGGTYKGVGASYIGSNVYLSWWEYKGLNRVTDPYNEIINDYTIHNTIYAIVDSCPSGTLPDSYGNCQLPDLSTYNGNPYGCIKAGGLPDFNFVPHGGNFSSAGFLTPTINVNCNSYASTLAKNALVLFFSKVAMSPVKYGPFDTIPNTLKRGFVKMKNLWNSFTTGTKPVDATLSLPRYNPDTNVIDVDIIPRDIPTGDDGVTPSRAPKFDIDAYNSFLRNEYFPNNPDVVPSASDPYITLSTLERFNRDNAIFNDNGTDPITYSFKPNNNIFKSTTGSSSINPVYDSPKMTPEFQPSPNVAFAPNTTVLDAPTFAYADPLPIAPPPVVIKVADIPSTNTVSNLTLNGRPVKQWTSTTVYPDGSTLQEQTQIDEILKTGSRTSTTINSTGASSTVSVLFDAPYYKSGSTNPEDYAVIKTSPVSVTPLSLGSIFPTPLVDPLTGLGIPNSSTSAPLPTISTATGQDLINAPMPSYSFPALAEFVPFDSNPITDMITGANLMFTNISNQISSTSTVFDNTKALLKGGWTPPVIPSGSCGESLAFNFHGKHIDLCPPLVNATAVGAPIVAPVVTIGGMVLSVTIMIGGF